MLLATASPFHAFWQALLSGCDEGLIWGLLAIGVFISFRVLDFADLTVEGSFTCGAATAATLISKGCNPWVATIVAIIAGALAGLVTATLHTKLKIPPILAGILTMIALYSINIAIMGNVSNLAISHNSTIFGSDNGFLGIPIEYSKYVVLGMGILIAAVAIGGIYCFFGTEVGSAIRATGDNQKMCRAQGINTDNMKIYGLVLSNALVGLSGAIFAQYQRFTDVNMGVGAIVIGLASVIIGETVFMKGRSFWVKLIAAVVGSVIYRIIIALAILIDIFDPFYMKLLTAIIVAIALSIPTIRALISRRAHRGANRKKFAALDALVTESAQPTTAETHETTEEK